MSEVADQFAIQLLAFKNLRFPRDLELLIEGVKLHHDSIPINRRCDTGRMQRMAGD